MPRFRFVAADSTGQVHDGAIDAATQTDARNKLASNGLAVRELEEVAGGPGPIPAPGRRSASRFGEPVEPISMRPAARPDAAESAGRGSALPLVLAAIALIISVATAVYSFTRDPYANRLSRYDFSTPEAAYMSHLRIQAAADFPAMMELQRRNESKQIREKLDTVHIRETAECRGKAILFIEFNVDSRPTREIRYFEPDPDHPRSWRITHLPDNEIRTFDQELAERVSRWQQPLRMGELAPARGMPRTP